MKLFRSIYIVFLLFLLFSLHHATNDHFKLNDNNNDKLTSENREDKNPSEFNPLGLSPIIFSE